MADYERLTDIFMDVLPEDNPFHGRVKNLVETLLANGVTFAKDTNVPDNPIVPGHDDQYNIAEMSYNNGYAKGYEDGSKTRKRGIWIAHTKHSVGWYECSECHVCGSPQWKCCPVCETKMEVSNG